MARPSLIPDSFGRAGGILWGFVFRENKASRVIEDNLDESLADSDAWVWLHFALSDHRARKFIEDFAAIPVAARTLLLSSEQRIQFHLDGCWTYGIIPDIEKDFEGHTLGVGRVAFAADARRFVTTRHHPMRVTGELRDRIEDGAGFASPAALFASTLKRFFDIVEARLEELSRQLENFEDLVLADRDDIDRIAIGPVRSELARYRRSFQGLRSALIRVLPACRTAQGNALAAQLQQLSQEAEDFDRDASALSDRARLLYEEMDTRIAAITNRSVRILTIISTLLIPPTFVVGAFGMNLPGIAWAHDSEGFAIVCGVCVALVVGCWLLLRRLGILP